MDYEKLYNEALERAKGMCALQTDKATMEYIFPQLRESEDERMLREFNDYLCEEIECRTYDIRDEKDLRTLNMLYYVKKNVGTWLEKQKENVEKEYVFRPLAGTDITIAAEQAIRRANEGDRLVLAFNGAYIPVRKGCNANKIVDIYDAFIEKQKEPHYTKRNALFDKCVENCDPEVMKEVSDKVDEMLGKEQKPNIEICPHSVKSKSYSETGYPIEDCDYGLEIALNILEKTLGKVQGFQTDDGIREHQTAIKAVKDAMKEQKPVQNETEREYVRTIKSIMADFIRDKKPEDVGYYQQIYDWLDGRHIEQKPDDDPLDDPKFLKGFDTGREVQRIFDEQKPVEWSEEDEKLLDFWLDVIDRNDWRMDENFCKASREFINRIKSLRPQSKQEWSEEDEKKLEDLVSLMAILEGCSTVNVGTAAKYNSWLNSFRSRPKSSDNWKPSEEQMKALQNAVALTACDKELARLYNQLKKL